jgi:hypothetical protein
MPIIGSEYSELLMGHSDAYGNAYNGLPDAKLEREYKRCEDALTIASKYGVAVTVEQQVKEIADLKTELADMRRIMAHLIDGKAVNLVHEANDVTIAEIEVSRGEKPFVQIHTPHQQ